MLITIKHREQVAGIFSDKRRYYLDVTVQFSEEEKAIIETRRLYQNVVDISPGYLGHTVFEVPAWVARVCFILCPFLLLSGCVVGTASLVVATGGLGTMLFLLGLCLLGGGIYVSHRLPRSNRTTVTIGEMFPGFSIMTFNPPHAKEVDEALRVRLVLFKNFLDQSAELSPPETFEL